MAYLPEFAVLDTINRELDRLHRKQIDDGELDPMDTAVMEKYVNMKVKILSELQPKEKDQVLRLGAEIEMTLLETSLEALGLRDDIKYVTTKETVKENASKGKKAKKSK